MEGQPKRDEQEASSSRWIWLKRAVILLLLSYALGCILGAYLLLIPPPRVTASPDPSAGTSRQGGPGSEARAPIERIERIERIQLKLPEGLRIPVWLAEPAPEPTGCVLLFHGRGGCHSVAKMRFVLSCGYAVLAPDFRAHGEAEGELSGFGYLEQAEVRATLAVARRRWPHARIVAWGRSMGAAAILFAAEETATLAGILLESPYSSLQRAFHNRLEQRVPRWLIPLTYGPVLVAQLRSGLWLDEIQPIRKMALFQKDQVLLVQGREDSRVQMDEYEAFLAALPGMRGLILEGTGHTDFIASGGAEYRATVRKQLAIWLQR